ncbi:ferritin [Corynebacterium uterequi]|nr:ferritin [Corynebacterium uterequi]
MKINDKLENVLNAQVTSEYTASLVYTQLAYHLKKLSFDGMATWMLAQAEEEREHAAKIAEHLLARGSSVELGDLSVPAMSVESPVDAFQLSLQHEQKVSEEIRVIARVADETGDLESRTLVNWFLDEQISEEDTVGNILDRLKIIGADGTGLLRLDADLGSRSGASED